MKKKITMTISATKKVTQVKVSICYYEHLYSPKAEVNTIQYNTVIQ